MLSTVTAVVREGKIELREHVELPEGSKLLVMVLPDEEAAFWSAASQSSLSRIWDNPADDVYARLLDAGCYPGALPVLRRLQRESPAGCCRQRTASLARSLRCPVNEP